MYTRVNGIVLGMTRHSDRVNILSLYTDTYGRISLITPAGGSSKTARARRASLMPLSIIETDINFHRERSLQSLGKFTLSRPNTRICGDPVKSAIALFIAEFISRAMRDAEPDPVLWKFLDTTVAALNDSSRPANIHIAFLAQFATFAGLSPDVTDYTPFAVFDMREGRYVDYTPPHHDFIADSDAIAPVLLSKLNYNNAQRWRIPTDTRRRMLKGLMTYYAIHLPGSDRLKSLDILRQIFS